MSKFNARKPILMGLLFAFLANTFGPIPTAQAQEFVLPQPGQMVPLSPAFNPPILKGIKVHSNNPFLFDFILDKGNSLLSNDRLREEANKLVKYFLASLTVPEKDLWVNLSPYEKNRIIPEAFGQTEMGRDLLAEDYLLKQITASLIYPEGQTGRKFWAKVYSEAARKLRTTNVPVNTFNKVWIIPEKAVVYENAQVGTAYIVESRLKVMLEQDYLSLQKHGVIASETKQSLATIGDEIIREVVIPELTKEVNEGKNFIQLRQVYNSLILAAWYKRKIKDSILARVYENKDKIAGINISDSQEKQKIYERYLQAFKKGSYNYIKEEIDPISQQAISRKYFSGGMGFSDYAMNTAMVFISHMTYVSAGDQAVLSVNLITASQAMLTNLKDIHEPEKNGESLLEILKKVKEKKTYEQWESDYDFYTRPNMIRNTRLASFVKGDDTLRSIRLVWLVGLRYSPEDMKQVFDNIRIFWKGDVKLGTSREAVKARRDHLLEILNGINTGEQLTIQELTGRLNQVEGYEGVTPQTVRDDLSLDKRFQAADVQAKLSRESIDREAVKARRVILLEDSDQNLLNMLEQKLNANGYEVHLARGINGNNGIKSRLRDHHNIGLIVSGGDISKENLGKPFLNIYDYLDPDSERINSDELRRLLNAIQISFPRDMAQINNAQKGGIDFNSDKINLQFQNTGQAIRFHIDQAQLARLQSAPGFVPVIINIQPMTDLRLWLGLNDQKPAVQKLS
jgi:hypothetical protein